MRETGLTLKRFITLCIVTLGCTALIAMRTPQMPTPDAFPTNTTRHALVSLLSINGPYAWWSQQKYIAAAEKLAHSFRKHHPDIDMVLLVVDDYKVLKTKDQRRLSSSGWRVHRMRNGIMPASNNWPYNRYYSAKLFSKLWIWRLQMYEQILYTDLDTLFIHSPEHLFHHMKLSTQSPAMVLDPTRPRHHHYFNAGVILLKPSEDEYNRLITAMDANNHHGEYAEQDFLNIFYHSHIVQLDARFNRQVCSSSISSTEEGGGCLNDGTLGPGKSFDTSAEKEKTVILHFSGENKPWNMQNCINQNIVQLCLFWKYNY